jgi:SAM-dependent methyltransferase
MTGNRVESHYTHGDLWQAIEAALAAAGLVEGELSAESLAPIDEFHVRGRQATEELGHALGLDGGMHVLDVGSGLGGPSRHLAAEHGCRITGLDLTAEYCNVAGRLADLVGLGGKVAYRQGDALAMPFENASFDAAYSQHVAMNIADKAALYGEVARVLKPGGRFGIYELLQGTGGEVHFPVPWAGDPSTSFLVGPEELRGLLEGAGFEIVSWRDTTAEGRAWFQKMGRRIAAEGPPPLGFHVLLGVDFSAMARNQVKNLVEDRIAPTEVICRKA